MEDQTKILISIDEYKEFIINLYEQGKLKVTLNQEIKMLEKKAKEAADNYEGFATYIQRSKDFVLGLAFRKERMGSDTREEQTDVTFNANGTVHIGSWFGFKAADAEELLKIGFTWEALIDYINKQWDDREKAQAKKSEEEEQS